MYLLSVPSVSSRYFNKIKLTSYLGKLPALSIKILWTSGKFGHIFANSVNPDETAPYEPFLIRIFTVCLVNLFFIPIFEI